MITTMLRETLIKNGRIMKMCVLSAIYRTDMPPEQKFGIHAILDLNYTQYLEQF